MRRLLLPDLLFQRSSLLLAALLAILPILPILPTLQAEDGPAIPKLLIEPSATTTSMAKCELTVGTLECKNQALSGSYAIKVIPFAFKNDHGVLTLAMSDENAQKMARGEVIEFSGVATSAKDGKTKAIKGKTKPDSNEKGAVNFVVTTPDGDLVFNSSYQVVAK